MKRWVIHWCIRRLVNFPQSRTICDNKSIQRFNYSCLLYECARSISIDSDRTEHKYECKYVYVTIGRKNASSNIYNDVLHVIQVQTNIRFTSFSFYISFVSVSVCKLSLHRVYWPSFPYVIFLIFLCSISFTLCLHIFFLFNQRIQCTTANVYIKFILYGIYM